MAAGYSGIPLSKKLGLAPPMTLVSIDAPREYRAWLGKLPNGVNIVVAAARAPHAVHVFATRRAALEDTIREIALPLGFVDVKVCAVSDVWSGLKLVVRKALR